MTTIARSLPLGDVAVDDEFWTPIRRRVARVDLIDQARKIRASGRLESLHAVARSSSTLELPTAATDIGFESDIAKWIEAASYCSLYEPSAELDALLDEFIGALEDAQCPDGYLNVYYTLVAPERRFTDLRDSHELYIAGHIIEAGVAHNECTGSDRMLSLAVRFADLLVEEFGPGGVRSAAYDGHEEIELALVRLAGATRKPEYLALAASLVDRRGTQPFFFEQEERARSYPGRFDDHFSTRHEEPERFREYNQSHLPPVRQTDAVGHAVRAMYLYAAMADIAAANADAAMTDACLRLWRSVTGRKLYVTGGVGSVPAIEGFGRDYDLPVEGGYSETCASIGLIQWAERMARLLGDGRYGDVVERALYNNVLAGASQDGTSYFYANQLASGGDVARQDWFSVSCCPPNFARTIASLQRLIYTDTGDGVAVNLYVSSTATWGPAENQLTIEQRSTLLVDGQVRLRLVCSEPVTAELRLRLPGWSRRTECRIDGEAVDVTAFSQRGHLVLSRTWRGDETIDLSFDVAPRRVWGDARLPSAAGKVSIARGPLVYCVEGLDTGCDARTLRVPRSASLREDAPRLGGIPSVTFDAACPDESSGHRDDDVLYRPRPATRTRRAVAAVPYYLWNNRGPSTMAVWLAEDEA